MKKSFVITLAFATVVGAGSASDWPTFRGTHGGVSSDGNVPAKFDESNRLWKTKLPGPGASSPITYGNKIFITAYSGYGTKIVAGFGGIISEVGAVMIVGVDVEHHTPVFTTAIFLGTSRGNFALALTLGSLLLAIAFITNVAIMRLHGASFDEW